MYLYFTKCFQQCLNLEKIVSLSSLTSLLPNAGFKQSASTLIIYFERVMSRIAKQNCGSVSVASLALLAARSSTFLNFWSQRRHQPIRSLSANILVQALANYAHAKPENNLTVLLSLWRSRCPCFRHALRLTLTLTRPCESSVTSSASFKALSPRHQAAPLLLFWIFHL